MYNSVKQLNCRRLRTTTMIKQVGRMRKANILKYILISKNIIVPLHKISMKRRRDGMR